MAKGWAVREDVDREDTERRAEILMAARYTFEDYGFDRTSVAAISTRAGVSRTTFYIYFASKQDAFEALAWQLRQRYLDAQRLDHIDEYDVETVISATLESVLSTAIEHNAFIHVLNNESVRNPEIRDIWTGIRYSAINRAANYVQRVQNHGLVDPVVTPHALALTGAGLNDQYARLVLDGSVSWSNAVETMRTIWLTLVGLNRS